MEICKFIELCSVPNEKLILKFNTFRGIVNEYILLKTIELEDG